LIETPGYLMRRRLLLRVLGKKRPGRLLEIGCGRGDLLARLAALGWEGVGLEISPRAATAARELTAAHVDRVAIVDDPAAVQGAFPLVVASEVLEHIPDDADTLRRWRSWVATDGRLVLTVPAHERYWTRSDDFVGHVRRYERADLHRLVVEAGFEVEVLWSFGFPVSALTAPLRHLVYRRRLARVAGASMDDRTRSSAFDSVRQVHVGRLATGAMEAIGAVAHWLQLPFLETDLGASYLVVARRVPDGRAS
jgi:SAM-dependent methyltransferase